MAQVWGHQEEDEECRPGQACEYPPLQHPSFVSLSAQTLAYSFTPPLIYSLASSLNYALILHALRC